LSVGRFAKIEARGIYRDPVRSSKEFFVKTSGLRWISMMLLAPIRLHGTGVGTAISYRACSDCTLLRKAKATTQEDHGLGATNDPPTQTLAA
jgi:hypothetical protein